MTFNPQAPPVYKPTSQKVAAPPIYQPHQANHSSAQLKPANNFRVETRPAPPVYRPQQQGVPVAQRKPQPASAVPPGVSGFPIHYRPRTVTRPFATNAAFVSTAAINWPQNSKTLQCMQQPQLTGDPTDYLFIHHTVSPYFSSGATPKSPGEHLDKVVHDIEEGTTKALDFPPLPVFTIDDPNGIYDTQTFSLSNRRLYVFKSSGSTNVKIRRAAFGEVKESLWKMTNESGGYNFPKLTNFGNKDVEPGGLLGEFKAFCQQNPNNDGLVIATFNFR